MLPMNRFSYRSGTSFLVSGRKPMVALLLGVAAISIFDKSGSVRCLALSSGDVSNAKLTPLSIQRDDPKVTLLDDKAISGAEVIAKHSDGGLGSLCFVVRRPG